MVRVGRGSEAQWRKTILTIRAKQKEKIKSTLDLSYLEFEKKNNRRPSLSELKKVFLIRFGKSSVKYISWNVFEMMMLDSYAGFGYSFEPETFEVTKL